MSEERQIDVEVGVLYDLNESAFKSGKRFIVNQGGSRSGKTYSILQLLISLCFEKRISVSIVSVSFPHLRRGAIRDFIEIMEMMGLYDPNLHTTTDQTYRFPTGAYMEFFSVDQPTKVRGPGRDILFINEANLIKQDTFEQLNMRTVKTVFMDYNPADEFSWIYDRVVPLPECEFIKSTYLDNPFLPKDQIRQIEALRDIDDNFWKVYGLGERGTAQATIYHKFSLYDHTPEKDYCFGLDFGFNHPNALVKVTYDDNRLYFEQKFFQSHTTATDLIEAILPIVGYKYVYCDGSRPEIIEEMRRAGISAYAADKSVKEGIDFVRSNHIFVHRESLDLQKEMRSYKWKTRPNGDVLDEPVKAFDDLMDAARYGAISYKDTGSNYHLMQSY